MRLRTDETPREALHDHLCSVCANVAKQRAALGSSAFCRHPHSFHSQDREDEPYESWCDVCRLASGSEGFEEFDLHTLSPRKGLYLHYKGGIYVVQGVAFNSEKRDECFVVYYSLERRLTWLRPLAMFLEWVEVPADRGEWALKRVQRFTWVEDLP